MVKLESHKRSIMWPRRGKTVASDTGKYLRRRSNNDKHGAETHSEVLTDDMLGRTKAILSSKSPHRNFTSLSSHLYVPHRDSLVPRGDAGSHTLTIRRILWFHLSSNNQSVLLDVQIKKTSRCFVEVHVTHFHLGVWFQSDYVTKKRSLSSFLITVSIFPWFLPLCKHSNIPTWCIDTCTFICSCPGFMEGINSWRVKTSEKYLKQATD